MRADSVSRAKSPFGRTMSVVAVIVSVSCARGAQAQLKSGWSAVGGGSSIETTLFADARYRPVMEGEARSASLWSSSTCGSESHMKELFERRRLMGR
jgi:hypothetical protein